MTPIKKNFDSSSTNNRAWHLRHPTEPTSADQRFWADNAHVQKPHDTALMSGHYLLRKGPVLGRVSVGTDGSLLAFVE